MAASDSRRPTVCALFAVPEQAAEWSALRAEHPRAPLCVAGDFNMSLGGPHDYGTKRGRELLALGLDAAGLACVTRTEHVPPGLPLECIQLLREIRVREKDLAKVHERAHDLDVDLHGPMASEHAREHRDALLGKSIGSSATTAPRS